MILVDDRDLEITVVRSRGYFFPNSAVIHRVNLSAAEIARLVVLPFCIDRSSAAFPTRDLEGPNDNAWPVSFIDLRQFGAVARESADRQVDLQRSARRGKSQVSS